MTHDSRFTIHDSTNEGPTSTSTARALTASRARGGVTRARASATMEPSSDEAIVFASSPCTRAPGRWITGASGRTTRMNETKRPTGRRRRGRRDDRRRDDRVATDRATDVERWTDDDWFFSRIRARRLARAFVTRSLDARRFTRAGHAVTTQCDRTRTRDGSCTRDFREFDKRERRVRWRDYRGMSMC